MWHKRIRWLRFSKNKLAIYNKNSSFFLLHFIFICTRGYKKFSLRQYLKCTTIFKMCVFKMCVLCKDDTKFSYQQSHKIVKNELFFVFFLVNFVLSFLGLYK